MDAPPAVTSRRNDRPCHASRIPHHSIWSQGAVCSPSSAATKTTSAPQTCHSQPTFPRGYHPHTRTHRPSEGPREGSIQPAMTSRELDPVPAIPLNGLSQNPTPKSEVPSLTGLTSPFEQPSSQAIHPQCARRQNHRRRAGRHPEGERRHPRQLPRREPRSRGEVRAGDQARPGNRRLDADYVGRYIRAGATMLRSSSTSSPSASGHTSARSNASSSSPPPASPTSG
jgi:hypothetical protein